ncbi:MAG: hypothetical protein JST20_07565 [Bacteroidetes bacterium]|nr:hypothetical protein [Bacteroidota bacterium]
MSNDILQLVQLRELFRRNNPHLINLPPARNETPEEILVKEENKRIRLIEIRQHLEVILNMRTQPQNIKSALNIYIKQEQNKHRH